MNTTKTTKTTKENDLSYKIIGSAIDVHRELGPGLLESTYEQCLAFELSSKRIGFLIQKPVPLTYKGIKLDGGYRLDFLIEDSIILEIKAVDHILKLHQAQLLTYMKLTGVHLGIMINFNAMPLKEGIRRFCL